MSVRNFLRLRPAGWGLLPLALLSGCSSGPVSVQLERRSVAAVRQDPMRPVLCLLPVEDHRPSAAVEVPGRSGLGPLVFTGDSVVGWVESELRRQLAAGFQLAAPAPEGGGRSLRVEVRNCYVRSVGGQLSAQVVLAAEWREGDTVRSRVVRGQRVGSVWWSVRPEVELALRLALEDAVAKLAADPGGGPAG